MGKKGPQKRGLGDRQVGAFSVFGPGIQQARSFFDEKRVFFKKVSNLGVDVIQPWICSPGNRPTACSYCGCGLFGIAWGFCRCLRGVWWVLEFN